MIPTQGQHSVPFFLRLTHFLSVFGVTPWYNFDQRRLVRPTLFRCYSSVLIMLLATSCIGLAYLRFHHVYDAEFSVEMFGDIALNLESLFMVSVTVLGMAYWNRDVWAKLYDQLRKVDCSTRFLCKSVGKPFILRYGAVVFILGNVYLFSLHHIDDLVLEQQTNSLNIYYAASFILTYYEFLITFTIVSITALIKSKYMCVNELLNVRKFKGDAFFNNVKEARILCLKIDEIVRIFNKLLGWPLLQIFFDFFLDILDSLISTTMSKAEDRIYRVGGGIIIINTLYLLQSGIWLAAIIFSCDSVVREIEEMLSNCYMLEDPVLLLPKELEELESLEKLIRNKRPKLTAAGFFEIKRSTLLSLLGTTTTYFIVALQFNSL